MFCKQKPYLINFYCKQKQVIQGKRSNFDETVHWYVEEKLTEV